MHTSLVWRSNFKAQRSSLTTTIICQRAAQELSIVRLCTYVDPRVENLWGISVFLWCCRILFGTLHYTLRYTL